MQQGRIEWRGMALQPQHYQPRVEAIMSVYRLVSHPDGLWLEGFNDDDEEWEIVDGPFDSRYEGSCALRRFRERQEYRDIRAA